MALVNIRRLLTEHLARDLASVGFTSPKQGYLVRSRDHSMTDVIDFWRIDGAKGLSIYQTTVEVGVHYRPHFDLECLASPQYSRPGEDLARTYRRRAYEHLSTSLYLLRGQRDSPRHRELGLEGQYDKPSARWTFIHPHLDTYVADRLLLALRRFALPWLETFACIDDLVGGGTHPTTLRPGHVPVTDACLGKADPLDRATAAALTALAGDVERARDELLAASQLDGPFTTFYERAGALLRCVADLPQRRQSAEDGGREVHPPRHPA